MKANEGTITRIEIRKLLKEYNHESRAQLTLSEVWNNYPRKLLLLTFFSFLGLIVAPSLILLPSTSNVLWVRIISFASVISCSFLLKRCGKEIDCHKEKYLRNLLKIRNIRQLRPYLKEKGYCDLQRIDTLSHKVRKVAKEYKKRKKRITRQLRNIVGYILSSVVGGIIGGIISSYSISIEIVIHMFINATLTLTIMSAPVIAICWARIRCLESKIKEYDYFKSSIDNVRNTYESIAEKHNSALCC